VTDILVAADSAAVVADIAAAVGGRDTTVRTVSSGAHVREAVRASTPDLVVLDLQIGNMGGMATCLDLRLEAGAGRLDDVPILMLLDRRADVFLARRSGADGFLVKPLDPIRVRRAVTAILAGDLYEDATGTPSPLVQPIGVESTLG
jgi:DNA-binding response OmpR family regulator